jgi:hypothetical protein
MSKSIPACLLPPSNTTNSSLPLGVTPNNSFSVKSNGTNDLTASDLRLCETIVQHLRKYCVWKTIRLPGNGQGYNLGEYYLTDCVDSIELQSILGNWYLDTRNYLLILKEFILLNKNFLGVWLYSEPLSSTSPAPKTMNSRTVSEKDDSSHHDGYDYVDDEDLAVVPLHSSEGIPLSPSQRTSMTTVQRQTLLAEQLEYYRSTILSTTAATRGQTSAAGVTNDIDISKTDIATILNTLFNATGTSLPQLLIAFNENLNLNSQINTYSSSYSPEKSIDFETVQLVLSMLPSIVPSPASLFFPNSSTANVTSSTITQRLKELFSGSIIQWLVQKKVLVQVQKPTQDLWSITTSFFGNSSGAGTTNQNSSNGNSFQSYYHYIDSWEVSNALLFPVTYIHY